LKHFLQLCVLITAASAVASAAIAPPCPGSQLDSGSLPVSVLTPTFSCQQQDKAYTDFVVDGLPSQAIVRFFYQPLAGFDIHTIAFAGNFLNPFTVSYTITMDLSVTPGGFIDRISGDLSNPADIGNPTNVKTVTAIQGTGSGTVTSVTNNSGTPLSVNGISFRVTDTYTPNGGAAVLVGNSFREVVSQVPEPTTMGLAGSALFLTGLFSRRRRQK